MRKVNIQLEVTLDDKNVPQQITWKSDDPPSNGKPSEAKAFMLSLFDKEQLDTLKIDLWSTEFEVGEMDRLAFYTIKGLAESYYRATSDEKMANDLARFAQYFGEEKGILKPPAE